MSEKSITAKKSFLFHWEGQEKKAVFRTDKQMPFTERERDRLAQVMTFNEVIDANIPTEDAEMRRNRKWQEIQHLFKVIRSSDRYSKGSIENAMWFYGTMGVTVTHFVMAIMNEFKFDRSLQMDAHLRWLYWSFDGGREVSKKQSTQIYPTIHSVIIFGQQNNILGRCRLARDSCVFQNTALV